MAKLKFKLGDSDRISTSATPWNEGCIYLSADDGGLYFDVKVDGVNERIRVEGSPEYIDSALAQAKESGEFDGKDGNDGYTPVRGTDYWTAADIAEIKSYVDEAILGGAW